MLVPYQRHSRDSQIATQNRYCCNKQQIYKHWGRAEKTPKQAVEAILVLDIGQQGDLDGHE